jgi:sugar lactone lactonase YvrE
MAETFNCPNCGAPLDYKGSDPIIRCPYCNGSVVVPDNLRAKPAFSAQPHNYTLSGQGNMNNLVKQARRFKEVKDLALAGNVDEAARIYCEITGATPEQAKASVQALAHGQPIMLTGLNLGEFIPSQPRVMVSSSGFNVKPVDSKTSSNIARSVGCGIGCIVIGIILFVLVTTIVPVMGGLAGVAVSMKPDIVLTILPYISNLPAQAGLNGYGTQDLSFGGEGTGPGLFSDVRAIAVDPSQGNIYAADYEGGRVQKFDAQGKFITQWILEGKNLYISSMTVDRQGNVFIDATSKLLQYDANGTLVGQLRAGKIDRFDNIALGADGSLYGTVDQDVIHFKPNGQVLSRVTATVPGDETLVNAKIAVDGLGDMYLLGTFNNAVFKFGPDGKFMNRFGSDGDQPGQFTAPYAIAVDGKSQVYVSDFKGVQIFSNDGRYINVVNVDFAYGLAFDDQGRLYITTNQKKVERYSLPQ